MSACPTSEDMVRGVSFVEPDGWRQIHRSVDAGEVEIETLKPSGETLSKVMRVYGIYPGWVSFEPDEIVEQTIYAASPPYPQLGLTAQVDGMLNEMPYSVSIAVDDTPAQRRLGDCVIEVWAVQVANPTEVGGEITREFLWFPTLGTGFNTRTEAPWFDVPQEKEIGSLRW